MLVPVWYLEQRRPGELQPLTDPPASTALLRRVRPSAALARYLYRTVGAEWNWRSRSDWDEQRWDRHLSSPETEFWVSWYRGRVTGYAELRGGEGDDRATTDIRYLGLLPGECGQRLGAQLVNDATRRAWTMHQRVGGLPPVERVIVNTSGNDGPAALHTYMSRGFRQIEEKLEDRPAHVAAI